MSEHERSPARVYLDPRLIAHVSHQLRTPLALVIGYAELLRTRDDDEIRDEAATAILTAARSLSVIIDDLLVLFALESGTISSDCVAVELGPLIVETTRELDSAPNGTSFVLDPSAGERWPLVWADRDHLRRILTSLLLRANSRAPDGPVRVAARDDGQGAAVVSIADASASMSDDELARLFDPVPTEIAGRADLRSSGLDLYMARRLVELHGGSIRAERGEPDGTTMIFTLPLAPSG